jgi:LPS-assembly lipoprotein
MQWGARRSLLVALAILLALGLASCGFQLRQTPDFAFKSVYLAVAPTSTLGIELKRHLAASNVALITDAAQQAEAQAILDILSELRTKTVVGVSVTGQVREFQLRLNLKFRLRTPQGKELIPETELVQQRALTYDEVFALAKEGEEALLYRNMQSDMVQHILRRMAAVKSL